MGMWGWCRTGEFVFTHKASTKPRHAAFFRCILCMRSKLSSQLQCSAVYCISTAGSWGDAICNLPCSTCSKHCSDLLRLVRVHRCGDHCGEFGHAPWRSGGLSFLKLEPNMGAVHASHSLMRAMPVTLTNLISLLFLDLASSGMHAPRIFTCMCQSHEHAADKWQAATVLHALPLPLTAHVCSTSLCVCIIYRHIHILIYILYVIYIVT